MSGRSAGEPTAPDAPPHGLMIPRRIETARLRGTAPESADGAFYRALLADPEVAATLWPAHLGGPRTPEQAHEILAADVAHWDAHGFGPWVFRERAGGSPVARGGLERTTIAGEDAVEILYAVASSRWGRGYATEIADAALGAARGAVGMGRVVAFTLTTNAASRRVLQRIGLSLDGEVEHAGLPHVLYRSPG